MNKLVQNVGIVVGYVVAITILNTFHFRQFTVHVVIYDTIFDVVLAGLEHFLRPMNRL